MNQMQVLRNLVDRGWIPLRQLGALLRSPDRSIYGRQRTKNPIPTVRIGGIERVYKGDVIEEIKTAKTLDEGEDKVLLSLLATGERDKERQDA